MFDKLELIKALPVCIATVGLVALGLVKPDAASVAAAGLTGVVTGYYGATVPGNRREDKANAKADQ